jgi:hypothetical protein
MSVDVLDEFAAFFDGIPDAVRNELAFFLVTLSDEWRAEPEAPLDYERAARILFDAETRTGRISNVISAAGFFDVYFSLNAGERFKTNGSQASQTSNAAGLPWAASRLAAIEAASKQWHELRRTTLSPAAIAATLLPPDAPRSRYKAPRKWAATPAADSGVPTDSLIHRGQFIRLGFSRTLRARINPSLYQPSEQFLRSGGGVASGTGMPSPSDKIIGRCVFVQKSERATTVAIRIFDLLADVVDRLFLPRHFDGSHSPPGVTGDAAV